MSKYIRSLALVSAFAAGAVLAQTSVEPLTDRRYSYPDGIPYKVDTNPTGRGPQSGYTLCNSTTQGTNSQCQLAMINHIDDFCLWGPPTPNATIADTEAATVAWCSKPGHGTRIMPKGTLTGVQFLRAPAYVLVVGLMNQPNIDMQLGDSGGEMDPHGADERGNPLGSLVYSNAFPSNNGNNNTFQQVISWHNFVGSNVFCFKICDPSVANSAVYCNNIFDLTGCNFVAPASYTPNVFETCDSDNMDPVGVYTGADGKTSTYVQPSVVVTLPSIRTPASSNCVTYSSAALYAEADGLSGGTTTSSGTTPTGSVTTKAGGSTTKASVATSTSTGTNTAKPTHTNAAMRVRGLEPIGLGVGPVMAIAASILVGLATVVAGL